MNKSLQNYREFNRLIFFSMALFKRSPPFSENGSVMREGFYGVCAVIAHRMHIVPTLSIDRIIDIIPGANMSKAITYVWTRND